MAVNSKYGARPSRECGRSSRPAAQRPLFQANETAKVLGVRVSFAIPCRRIDIAVCHEPSTLRVNDNSALLNVGASGAASVAPNRHVCLPEATHSSRTSM
jgi:hypothetical protein